MEEPRKSLLLAGICLGDITLALAAVADTLPPYAENLDVERLLAGCSDEQEVRRLIDEESSGEPEAGALPPGIVRTVLDRAVARGKLLSAIRCLEILGERDAYVERYLDKARRAVREGKNEEAARALVLATDLDLPDGVPLFQYTGPALHETCTDDPEKCITRMERESAVLRALKYLLPSDRVHQVVSEIEARQRDDLLVSVARVRDPNMGDFLSVFEKAHKDLSDIREHAMADVISMVKRVEDEVARFAGAIGGVSAGEAAEKEALDRLRLTTAGLAKELTGLETLVRERQFRRLTRRLEQFLESSEEIDHAAKAFGGGGAHGSVFEPILGLIREIQDGDLLGRVREIEERMLSLLVTMLGRQVQSDEGGHLVFVTLALRELAFKYPAGPLVCCVTGINDRWTVVPVWESPVAEILRTATDEDF